MRNLQGKKDGVFMAVTDRFKAYAAWLSVCFFWGTTYLAIRVGVQHMPPALFAGIRWAAAGVIFLAYLRWRKMAWPDRRQMGHMTVIGGLLLVVANGCVVWAEQWVPSGLTALIVATLPLWVAGIEALLPHGSPMTVRKVLGIGIGFAGLVVLFYPDLKAGAEPAYLHGAVALLAAPCAWALGSLYAKSHAVSVNPLMAAAVQMIVAGAVLGLIGTGMGEWSRLRISPAGLAAMAYLIVFGSIVGYGSFVYALAHLPTTKVSLFAYVNPVIAVFLGWLILDERLDPFVILATVLVFAGVLLVKSSR
jgi:drug/metabolite transporter (DMT)-like permease